MIINISVLSCILILTIQHQDCEWVLQEPYCLYEHQPRMFSADLDEKCFNQNAQILESLLRHFPICDLQLVTCDPFLPPHNIISTTLALWAIVKHVTCIVECNWGPIYWQSSAIRAYWEGTLAWMMIMCLSMEMILPLTHWWNCCEIFRWILNILWFSKVTCITQSPFHNMNT